MRHVPCAMRHAPCAMRHVPSPARAAAAATRTTPIEFARIMRSRLGFPACAPPQSKDSASSTRRGLSMGQPTADAAAPAATP
eukprot:6590333-Prymnesium_polylepis.1